MTPPPVIPLDAAKPLILALPADAPLAIATCPALAATVPKTLLHAQALDTLLTTSGCQTRLAIELTGPGQTPARLWTLIERLNANRFSACWRFTTDPTAFTPSAVIPMLAGKLAAVFIEQDVTPAIRAEIEHRLAGVGLTATLIH